MAKEDLFQRGLKAFFKVCRSFGSTYPNAKTLLHIFDHTILPILTYGSEVWGTVNPLGSKIARVPQFKIATAYDGNHADKLNMKFCKYILQVHKASSNNAVLGELGRYPMYINIAKNIVSYWHHLEMCEDRHSLVKNALIESKKLHAAKINSWFSTVNFILAETDLITFEKKPISTTKSYLIDKLLTTLKETHEVQWKQNIFDDYSNRTNCKNKLRTYRLFKNNYIFENYLIDVKNSKQRKTLTKLRISAHDLEIERGRYKGKTVEERLCQLCSDGVIEDELHFLTNCERYSSFRLSFYTKMNGLCKNFMGLSDKNKFIWILSNEDPEVCRNLAFYCNKITDVRSTTLSAI